MLHELAGKAYIPYVYGNCIEAESKVRAKYYKEVEKEEEALNYCSMIKSKSSEEMQTHAQHSTHTNISIWNEE